MDNKKVKKVKLSLDMEICSDLMHYIKECEQQEIDVENICVKNHNLKVAHLVSQNSEMLLF